MEFLMQLGVILLASLGVQKICKRVKIPSVVGQLLVGILLGSAGLNWLSPTEGIHLFSEIGVILLLFIAGLECEIEQLRKYMRPACIVALLGIVMPMILGTGASHLLGISLQLAIFIGLVLAATSVSISVDVLKELKQLQTKEGTVILGASVVDDLVVVLIVSICLPLLQGQNFHMSDLSLLLLKQGVFILGCLVLLLFFHPLKNWLSQHPLKPSTSLSLSLAVCLGMAYFASIAELSTVIGAFFAGLFIGQLPKSEKILENVSMIGSQLFIPVFLTSIGLTMTFQAVTSQWELILLLTVIAIISKLYGGYFGAKVSGFSTFSSYMIGAGMVSRGEMALVVLQMGQQTGLIARELYSVMLVVIIATTVMAPFVLAYFTKKVYGEVV